MADRYGCLFCDAVFDTEKKAKAHRAKHKPKKDRTERCSDDWYEWFGYDLL